MKKHVLALSLLALLVNFSSCTNETKNKDEKETYSSGSASVFVEESIVPIFGAVTEMFQFTYENAKITTVSKSENEIVNLLLKDSVQLAVIPRKLTTNELKHFEGKKVVNMTAFAKDAIIFVSNIESNDSLIDVKMIFDLIKNPEAKSDKVIVFDNITSSLVQFFKEKAGVDSFGENVYFAKDTKDVIEYTSKNNKAIGVVGINWLLQPNEEISKLKESIKSLKVLSDKDKNYYLPTQSNIANGNYPLIRELFIIDVQGKSGLGKGIASYAASEKGQRIVLKAGLFPVNQPTREIIINKN